MAFCLCVDFTGLPTSRIVRIFREFSHPSTAEGKRSFEFGERDEKPFDL